NPESSMRNKSPLRLNEEGLEGCQPMFTEDDSRYPACPHLAYLRPVYLHLLPPEGASRTQRLARRQKTQPVSTPCSRQAVSPMAEPPSHWMTHLWASPLP